MPFLAALKVVPSEAGPTRSANLMPVPMVSGSPSDLPQTLMVQLTPQTVMDTKRPRVGQLEKKKMRHTHTAPHTTAH